ncbi:hypothetical protein D4R52_01305 [bacterium]|nr:MAG: hypothetical protein D4R52_01305 [bacterium]
MAYVIQGLVIIIVVGVIYSLWKTTRSYGGLIGAGLKWIGLGIVFFSLEAVDRALGYLSFVNSFVSGENAYLAHNALLLLGLLFSAIGFSRLTRLSK